jgi:hypothetical protein
MWNLEFVEFVAFVAFSWLLWHLWHLGPFATIATNATNATNATFFLKGRFRPYDYRNDPRLLIAGNPLNMIAET